MKKVFLIVVCVLVSTLSFAQPIPGGRPDDGGAGTHEDTQMPIGTATLFLLTTGSLVAVYKAKKMNKRK